MASLTRRARSTAATTEAPTKSSRAAADGFADLRARERGVLRRGCSGATRSNGARPQARVAAAAPALFPRCLSAEVAGRGRGGGVLGHLAPGRGAGDFMSLQDTCAVGSFQVHVRIFQVPATSGFSLHPSASPRLLPYLFRFGRFHPIDRLCPFVSSSTSDLRRATCYVDVLRALSTRRLVSLITLYNNLKSYLLSHALTLSLTGPYLEKLVFCLNGPYLTRRATIGRLANPPLAGGGSFATSLRATLTSIAAYTVRGSSV